MRRPYAARAAPALAGSDPLKTDRRGSSIRKDDKRSLTSTQVAVIAKSAYAELRVSLKTWRGSHKIEIREATAAIPSVFFPTATGISIDVCKIGELIAALEAAQAEARARGLLAP
jgi:hypothetical protein